MATEITSNTKKILHSTFSHGFPRYEFCLFVWCMFCINSNTICTMQKPFYGKQILKKLKNILQKLTGIHFALGFCSDLTSSIFVKNVRITCDIRVIVASPWIQLFSKLIQVCTFN